MSDIDVLHVRTIMLALDWEQRRKKARYDSAYKQFLW